MKRAVLTIVGPLSLVLTAVLHAACRSRPVTATTPRGGGLERIGEVPRVARGWYKLQFLNREHGWLAGGATLWETNDGGKTWSRLYALRGGDQTGHDIDNIQFVTPRRGWMQSGASLYETVDGGRSWNEVITPLSGATGILGSSYLLGDARTGWVAGGLARHPRSAKEEKSLTKYDRWETAQGVMILEAAIFRTDDGGKTWTREFLPSSTLSRGKIRTLYIRGGEPRIALGLNAPFYSRRPLKSWRRGVFDKGCIDERLWQETDDERFPMAVSFVGQNIGWLSFKDGYMAKTTDGGRSWCDLVQRGSVRFEERDGFFVQLYFVSAQHGFGLGSDGGLYETTDAGKTWRKLARGLPEGLVRFDWIYFVDPQSGWAVSKDGIYRISP